MDYQVLINTLNSKQSELEDLKKNSEDVYNELNSSYLSNLGFELSSLSSNIKTPVERLKKGCTNSNTWLKNYVTELNSLESSLSNFSSSNLTKPTEFGGEFVDLFGKKTLYMLKSDYVDPKTLEENLGYGTFTLQSFTASNGVKIPYYLYLPDKVQDGLPVMVYMHGGSSHGTSKSSWTSNGLTRLIADKEVTPKGIVICPYIKNFEGDNIAKGIRELTDSVVSNYNADTNRISVSGHSYGAITAYRIVNQNPNYFSAVVPISGYDKVTGAFQGVDVWAFHGSKDLGSGQTNYNRAVKAVNAINSTGGNATMYTFKGAGHSNVQNYTYKRTFLSPDGKEETVLEWALRQTKNK